MEKYNFFKQGGPYPSEEQMLDTRLFYQNAGVIYARFDDWKDNDRFYFIPLFMEMTYYCFWAAEMAPDPVWLGSFIQNTFEHPELFALKCPECGKTVFTHHYNGSPLSGTVHLAGKCDCGWKGYDVVSGWHNRATALRDQLGVDVQRYRKYELQRSDEAQATVAELLQWLRR